MSEDDNASVNEAPAKVDEAEENTRHPLEAEIDRFTKNITGLRSTLPLVFLASVGSLASNAKQSADFLEKFGEKIESGDSGDSYKIPPEHTKAFEKLQVEGQELRVGIDLIPSSFLISIVSQFDVFLGRLLKWLYSVRPEILSASGRSISYADLLNYDSVDEAREHLVEKEVESFLRESHIEHFNILERKLEMPLRKGLECWPQFVELCERRNLAVHADRIVSRRYLEVCREHGCELSEGVKAGDRLEVDPQYFVSSYRCLYEIGFKLAQTVWRKLEPSSLDKADTSIINTSYTLLHQGRNNLARVVAEFGCSQKRHSSESARRYIVLNLAQSLLWLDKEDECGKVLAAEDWSASGLDLKLAVAVLQNEFDEAARLMAAIGKNGEITKSAFREWPIFKRFRASEQFSKTFREVFDEDFVETSYEPKGSTIAQLATVFNEMKELFDESDSDKQPDRESASDEAPSDLSDQTMH